MQIYMYDWAIVSRAATCMSLTDIQKYTLLSEHTSLDKSLSFQHVPTFWLIMSRFRSLHAFFVQNLSCPRKVKDQTVLKTIATIKCPPLLFCLARYQYEIPCVNSCVRAWESILQDGNRHKYVYWKFHHSACTYNNIINQSIQRIMSWRFIGGPNHS